MIILNLWGTSEELKQRLAARVEYEMLTIGVLVERTPKDIAADALLDWQQQAETGGVGLLIFERPYPEITNLDLAKDYIEQYNTNTVDIMVVANNTKEAEVMQRIEEVGEHIIDVVMEETKLRYMSRAVMDAVDDRGRALRRAAYANKKSTYY